MNEHDEDWTDPYEDLCQHCGTRVGYGHPDFHLNDCGCQDLEDDSDEESYDK